jgi:hypothetical protein
MKNGMKMNVNEKEVVFMIEVELLEGIVGSYVGSYVVFIFQLAESAHPFCGGFSILSQRGGV